MSIETYSLLHCQVREPPVPLQSMGMFLPSQRYTVELMYRLAIFAPQTGMSILISLEDMKVLR